MKIEMLKVKDLIPYERNPRNNKDAVDVVANSIKEFGFKNPIIIDKDNVIVAGHTRLLAAKKLKIKEVPCVRADDLTDEQVKAFRIADNSTAQVAEWDFDLLKFEIEDLPEFDFADFGLENYNDFNPDDFGDEFSLPNGDKPEICQMTFTLHQKQKELIEYAMEICGEYISETFGNTNKNGNALYEVVRQWAELRK